MKKIYFSILFLALFGSIQAQRSSKEFFSFSFNENANEDLTALDFRGGSRDAFDTVYSQTFADSLPVGWITVDNAGFCGWKWTNLGPQGQYSSPTVLNSTTKANGYMILDGDLCNAAGGATNVDAFFQSPAIDLTGIFGVKVEFQHQFRYCCVTADARFELQVSTDSVNWTNFDVKRGVVANTLTANVVRESVNISSVAANQPKVWIRFYKTGASHYFWMIDDVALVEAPDNDIKLTNADFGSYSKVPTGQQQPITFSGTITNDGAATQNNVHLNVNVNSGASQFNSASAALPVSQMIDVSTTTAFTPTAKGTYSIVFNAVQDESDTIPANNTKTVLFTLTDSVFSQDNNKYTGSGWWNGSKKAFEIGSVYEIAKNTEATSISFVLHGTTTAGALVKVKLYEDSPVGSTDDPTMIGESEIYTVLTTDKNTASTSNPKAVTLSLINPVPLEAGKVYIAMVENISDGVKEVAIASGTDLINTSYILYDPATADWFQRAGASAMVRLNISPSVGVKESNLSAKIHLYPNPASDNSTLAYELASSSNVTLKVFDVTGKEVMTVIEGNKSAGKHLIALNTAQLTAGVYYYTLSVNADNITKKLVVVK